MSSSGMTAVVKGLRAEPEMVAADSCFETNFRESLFLAAQRIDF